MKYYEYKCGCKFQILSENPLRLDINPNNLRLDCPKTWDMMCDGNVKGVFQLESQLGHSLSKRFKPRSIEELAALISLMRPACVSGDTTILTNIWIKKNKNNRYFYKRTTLRDLYENQHMPRHKTIISYNEQTGYLEANALKQVISMGIKPVFKIKLRKLCRNSKIEYYDLKCTDDHKLLSPNGWVMLQDLQKGDRFAVLKVHGSQTTKVHPKGFKYFRETCFKHYYYRCIFCDWLEGSLDVNHIEGNKQTNNEPDNLSYMCPNHHRMYTEKSITPEQVIEARKKFELPQMADIVWAEFLDKEYVEHTDVYDVVMEAPHHNFIAGDVVVHNCLEAMIEDKNLTNHYIDRKHGKEEVTYVHPTLEPILKNTYGILVFQEQAMKIAQEIAGFSLQEADNLRKAAGKKLPEEMAKVKKLFMEKGVALGKATEAELEEIFSWIEKSQRYSFNASHAVSYAYYGYITAYYKAHFIRPFFTSWLYWAKEKIKPQEEVHELVNNAKLMDIEVCPPDFRKLNSNFSLIDKKIYFGLTNIKGIGESVVTKMNEHVGLAETKLGKTRDKWTWMDFLLHYSQTITSTAVRAMISSGALDYFRVPRSQMTYEYELYSQLTDKEQLWCQDTGRQQPALKHVFQDMIDCEPGRGKATSNKKRHDVVKGLLTSLEKPPYSLTDSPEWIAAMEEFLLGISLTCSRVDGCNKEAANCNCRDFLGNGKQYVLIAAEVNKVKEHTIKKKGDNEGKKMAFLTLSDSSCAIDGVIFGEQWEEYKNILTTGNTVLVSGERSKKDKSSLQIQKAWQI